MKRFLTSAVLSAVLAAGLLTAATAAFAAPLKLGVSAGPYGEILDFTAKLAAKEGIEAKVIEFTDWKDRAEDPAIKRFIALYRSPEVRQFIETRFNGSIIPTW